MNRSKNIFTNGNLIPMIICTPVAVTLLAIAVTLICVPFKIASFLETFLYSSLLFLVVASIVEIPLLIIDAIKLIRYKVSLKREAKKKDETFVLIINNGGLYLEVFEFDSRKEAVTFKLKLRSKNDTRNMIITTFSCAEKCYGIKRDENKMVVIQKQQAASYEFPYGAFVFDTTKEVQDFIKECLVNQKICIISYDEYKNLSEVYLASDPGSKERSRIINYLDTKINNFNKEVK